MKKLTKQANHNKSCLEKVNIFEVDVDGWKTLLCIETSALSS